MSGTFHACVMSMRTASPAPTSFLAGSQYVVQLRGATRRGMARRLRQFFNTQAPTNRAAPARREAADAARPIKSIQTHGYKGCGRADLINIVNTDA